MENDLNSSTKPASGGTTTYGNIYGSLDRKLKMLNVGNGHAVGERRRTVQTSNDLHDYAEIYTPSKEIMGSLDPDNDIRPPTPPLHRFPSWVIDIFLSLFLNMSFYEENELLFQHYSSCFAF